MVYFAVMSSFFPLILIFKLRQAFIISVSFFSASAFGLVLLFCQLRHQQRRAACRRRAQLRIPRLHPVGVGIDDDVHDDIVVFVDLGAL